MATIQTSLQLFDGMSPTLKNITKTLDSTIKSFQAVETASGSAVDTSALQSAQKEVMRVATTFDAVEKEIRDATSAQAGLNSKIKDGADKADGLMGAVKRYVGAFAGLATVKKVGNWMTDSLSFADVQNNAEQQLQTVLINVGADTSVFDEIKQKAAAIQGISLYGDEAMLGGAAELATYISDGDAIKSMMDTLADYAAGMSGGGAVDSRQMVEYATQLGKALDGTYDGLTKKGFELSDAQKAIIETGTDMQKALVLEDVIAQSWDGLAEQMASLPQGKIEQFKNTFGDMREEIGNRLYPVVGHLFETFADNFPQIEALAFGLCNAFQWVVLILSGIVDVAGSIVGFFVDNWSLIAPIIWGVVAALAAHNAATLVSWATKAKDAAVAGLQIIQAGLLAAKMAILNAVTYVQIAAQHGLNAAMYLCPLAWKIALIVILIAIIYAAVAAINKWKGTTVSATGIICGAFMAALAFIGNLFVGFYNLGVDIFTMFINLIATFVNFLGNVFKDPIGSIARLFSDLADHVLNTIQAIAKAIDAVFGSSLAEGVRGWRDSLRGWVEEKYGAGVEIMPRLTSEDMYLDRFEYGKAYDKGYQFGEGLAEKFDITKMFGGGLEAPPPNPAADAAEAAAAAAAAIPPSGNLAAYEPIDNASIADTAENTAAMRDSMEMSKENLKYIRDIAEREQINKFTTAEIKVDLTNNNSVSEGFDMRKFGGYLRTVLEEEMMAAAEGVH